MARTKAIIAAVAVVLSAVAALASPSGNMKQAFESFKAKHAKKYASPAEEAQRYTTFVKNMKRAAMLQATNPLATFGASPFADQTEAEFKSKYHNGEQFYARAVRRQASEPHVDTTAEQKLAAAGQSIDWRQKGAVTYVKNQGQCGSCWSFSTTGGIEGQWFLAGNPLVALSEQEFVSCDTIDQGCNGGLMDNAYTWVLQAHNGTLVTEDSYPYVSGNGEVPACNMAGTKFGAQITGYENIAHSETTMASWVYANGPLSIAVDATSWQTYTGGIMTNCISQQLDHGVLIVGFDSNNQPPYWIIKNSWATSWGENGYIRVEMGTNQCLITSYPCSAKAAKNGPVPPTPPAPGKKDFTQKRCKSPKCDADCTQVSLPQDECIAGATYSYKVRCGINMQVDSYIGRKCEGTPIKSQSNPVGQCDIVIDSKTSEVFIQNLCHAGPAPPPPAPTPSPAPPAGQTFVQMDCSDSACSQNCQNATFQANTCLPLSGGGSAMADCQATQLVLTEYPLSSDCTGMSIPSNMPLNQCLANGDGQGYFENFCPPTFSGAAALSNNKVLSQRARRN